MDWTVFIYCLFIHLTSHHPLLNLSLFVFWFLLITLVLSHCFDLLSTPVLISVPSRPMSRTEPCWVHLIESELLGLLQSFYSFSSNCSTCHLKIVVSWSSLFWLHFLWSMGCWNDCSTSASLYVPLWQCLQQNAICPTGGKSGGGLWVSRYGERKITLASTYKTCHRLWR